MANRKWALLWARNAQLVGIDSTQTENLPKSSTEIALNTFKSLGIFGRATLENCATGRYYSYVVYNKSEAFCCCQSHFRFRYPGDFLSELFALPLGFRVGFVVCFSQWRCSLQEQLR